MTLRTLSTVAEMLPHLGLIQQLTPSLTAAEYERLLSAMVPHRYAMVAVFDGSQNVGLSGYWIGHKLYCGRYLEIDNFVVDRAQRSKGVGQLLVQHLIELAAKEDCECVMLDAYLENTDGHRFYERQGFQRKGYHFIRKIE